MKKTDDPPILPSFGSESSVICSTPKEGSKKTASRSWPIRPGHGDETRKQFSSEAIRKWLNRYHVSGLPALDDKE